MTKAKFVNRRSIPIEAGGFKGTVEIPVILTDQDLHQYIVANNKSREILNQSKEGELPLDSVQIRIDARKHFVKSVDFPGLTIDDFRGNKRPYPAISQQISDAVEPLIDEAFNSPKSQKSPGNGDTKTQKTE